MSLKRQTNVLTSHRRVTPNGRSTPSLFHVRRRKFEERFFPRRGGEESVFLMRHALVPPMNAFVSGNRERNFGQIEA